MKKIKKNSLIVFNEKSCNKEIYDKYYKELFPIGKCFVFLGEIRQMPDHCIILDLETGLTKGAYQIDSFRLAKNHEI